jgi:hypothetical protein
LNRRDALAALVSLPALTRITSGPVAPTDVIVVECAGRLTCEHRARVEATLRDVWPGRRIVVCDDGMRIKVVGE